MNDLNFLSAVAMADSIRARKISPVELIDAHLQRIEQLNHEAERVCVHEYRRRACGSSLRGSCSRLHCRIQIRSVRCMACRISVKSSVDVAGWPCECGSALRKGYIPSEDAPLVTRLRAAGAILLGNTNAPEFLMAYETDNLLHGRTNNPLGSFAHFWRVQRR